jgi:hypothetical protein
MSLATWLGPLRRFVLVRPMGDSSTNFSLAVPENDQPLSAEEVNDLKDRLREYAPNAFGVPGAFCTSLNERDWTKRSWIWRRGRSIRLSRL